MIIVNKYFTEISGNCIIFPFSFWIIAALHVVLILTTFAGEYLVGKRETVDEIAMCMNIYLAR